MSRSRHLALLLFATLTGTASAADIEGVLPASMDQPRIYLAVSRTENGEPLTVKDDGSSAALAKLMGEKPDPRAPKPFAIEAFLDTGASATMLSQTTADALGLKAATFNAKPVTFYDVGVAGREAFGVTEPVFLRAAEYSGKTDGGSPGAYRPAGGPVPLKTRAAGGILDELGGAIDIAGTPVMAGKVMAVDCRPIAKFDKLRTQLLPPADKDLPKTSIEIPLTMVDFDRFTQLEPKGAPPVHGGPNPMIGPDPFKPGSTKSVNITHHGKTAKLTMLLDTGSASTMISIAKAKELGLDITPTGQIKNVPVKAQFSLPIGGIGGSADVNGCFVDAIELPVTSGEPIRYVKAPVLVKDVTVKDEATGETFTLDGVFGMNYLVASASVTGGLNAGIGDIHDGPFDFFTVDFVKSTLNLQLRK